MTGAGSVPSEGEAGFALVAVLMFLVLVSAVVASFAVAARTSFLISSNEHQKLRLEMLAESLVTALPQRLLTGGAANSYVLPLDSTKVACTLGRYTVELRVQDQTGLIDLNAAADELIATGLRSLGLAAPEAASAAKTIESFRAYEAGGRAGGAHSVVTGGLKGAPFESVAELSDIEPLDRFEISDLRQVFTVQSRQPWVLQSRSPRKLADELKATPGVAVRQDWGGQDSRTALAIEITVRNQGSAIRGYAGYVIEQSDLVGNPVKRIEPLFEPSFGDEEEDEPANCPIALRTDITRLAGVE